VVDLAAHPHLLVTGATRSGKSTVTARFLAELAPRPVALVGIDAKGGMELGAFGPRLTVLATTRAQAATVLEGLIGVARARMEACAAEGARSIWELPAASRPVPVVVVVDEVAELFLSADKAGKEEAARCVNALVRLAQLGAALGIHLWISGQRFGSDLGPGATLLRAQLAGRICHRVADTETAAMTLSGLGGEAVAAALRIGADLPGVAVVGDDGGTWTLGRSTYLSAPEFVRVAAENIHQRVDIPVLTALTTAQARENNPETGREGGHV
jgi:S-DNA-T family DNA segregation ATPase FtsK/SpoIIIE